MSSGPMFEIHGREMTDREVECCWKGYWRGVQDGAMVTMFGVFICGLVALGIVWLLR
jgi:hypothetical protein